MDKVILSVSQDLCEDLPPHEAPSGYRWTKDPDEFIDGEIHKSEWWYLEPILEPILEQTPCVKKTEAEVKNPVEQKFLTCPWKCPNEHMENHYCYEKFGGYSKFVKDNRKKIKLEQKHTNCKHKTHVFCTNSSCCDWFEHDGDCYFISEVDGKEEGWAVRYGDQ